MSTRPKSLQAFRPCARQPRAVTKTRYEYMPRVLLRSIRRRNSSWQSANMKTYRGLCFTNMFANKFGNRCEQFANRCSRGLREQPCCSRNSLVCELIREQFANKPSLLCFGIFTQLAYFGGYFERYHVF